MKGWHTAIPVAWVVALGLAALLSSILGPTKAVAQTPWPTPPPAPIGTFPQVIPAFEIVPVPAPGEPGSMALQVDPIFAGPVPRIPPRPSTPIVTGETDPQSRVTLRFDAGTIDQTVQLTYQPLRIDQTQPAPPGSQIRRAFRVRLFDHKAIPMDTSFRYPVRLILSPHESDLTAASDDPARLLMARFDPDGNRWQRLVTTYQSASNTLSAQILRPGLFALVAQPPPVSG